MAQRKSFGATRRWRSRASVVLCVLTAGVFAATGTSFAASKATSSASAAPVPLNIAVYTGSFNTWLPEIADEAGFFSKNGIDATLTDVTSGSIAFAAMANGAVNMGMGDLSLAGPPLEKGQRMTLIAGAVSAAWELVGSKTADLPSTYPASVTALAGKPVAVAGLGTSSYYYLRQLSIAAGLGANGITYQAITGAAAQLSALESGQVAAEMLNPELAYYLNRYEGYPILYNFSNAKELEQAGKLFGSTANRTGGWMFLNNSWIAQYPGAEKKVQLALEEADVWLHNKAHFTQVVSILSASQNLPNFAVGAQQDQVVKAVLPYVVSYITPAAPSVWMNFWVRAGLLPAAISTKSFVAKSAPTSAAEVVANVKKAGKGSLGKTA